MHKQEPEIPDHIFISDGGVLLEKKESGFYFIHGIYEPKLKTTIVPIGNGNFIARNDLMKIASLIDSESYFDFIPGKPNQPAELPVDKNQLENN